MDTLATGATFITFLRTYRCDILAEWERRVRALPPAARLDRQSLIDHMPVILDDIAEVADASLHSELPPPLENNPDRHAIARLQQGYDLGEVVTEYSLLREIIQELSGRHAASFPSTLRIFNRVLDDAIRQAVYRYAETSQRLLKALDAISMLAFGEMEESAVLHTLLEIMMQASAAVDEVTVLLREGDLLKVRAVVGLTSERDAGFTLRIGEGFSGTIAAQRAPLFLRSATTDPLVRSQFLRDAGVKALYGVPLMDGGDLLGVAHMGSRTAYEFLDEDMLAFRAMANRAAQLIIETRLKRELRSKGSELEAVLASAQIGTWRWRLDQDEIQCDVRTRALFGMWPGEPMTFERFLATVAPEDRERVRQANERAMATGEDYRARYRIIRPDGEHRFLSARGGAVLDGNTRVFLGTVLDRTDEAYAERERELFLAALGHDLRGPLNAIGLASDSLLRHAALPEAAAQTVTRIARSTERMARLIEQLLDFAQARAGQPMQLERHRLELAELWHHVLDEIRLAENEQRVVLRSDGNTSGEWDADRLLQLFQNLLSNALQHGDPSRPITITLSSDAERVACEVHNCGAPIPPEMMPVLFDPFRRGPAGHGLGLGLYISRQIVTAHGGTVEARSTAGEGTTFRVVLPRRAA
jgi:signal transduction histidine kinase